ncbi:MAG: dithiobiotin synthetase [Peptococcaceae bacterium]|nr:dithiobiotin synthetase [Peptococcaceae bacterium]
MPGRLATSMGSNPLPNSNHTTMRAAVEPRGPARQITQKRGPKRAMAPPATRRKVIAITTFIKVWVPKLGLRIKGIIYNGYDEKKATLAEKTNPNIIEQITGVPTLGIIPRGRNIDVETGQVGNCLEIIQDNIDFSLLLK